MRKGLEADEKTPIDDSHPHVSKERGHIEVSSHLGLKNRYIEYFTDTDLIQILPIYAPTEAPLTNLHVPFDGTCLTIGTLNLLPTSRGTVTLASTDPTANPIIDPNYYDTETDRAVLRHGVRLALRATETSTAQEFIAEEYLPLPNQAPLHSTKSTDEEIDERVKQTAATWFHFAGSAAMGKVVDTDLRVKGVEGLRVCDVSVLPCPIGAHYQVVTYAIAEQAAEIIANEW